MKQRIQQIFDVFKENQEDVHLQWQMIDQLVAEGETDVFYELGHALGKAHDEESIAPIWAIESIYEYLEDVLALTPGINYAQTLIKLIIFRESCSWQHDKHRRRLHRLAPLLASAQSTDILLELINGYQQNQACIEFLAVLVQEMVLHGILCDQFHLIGHFVDQLRVMSHPLARLPLTLLPIEQLFPNLFSLKGWNELERESIAFSKREEVLQIFQEECVAIEENISTSEQERIRTVITPWTCKKSEIGVLCSIEP